MLARLATILISGAALFPGGEGLSCFSKIKGVGLVSQLPMVMPECILSNISGVGHGLCL